MDGTVFQVMVLGLAVGHAAAVAWYFRRGTDPVAWPSTPGQVVGAQIAEVDGDEYKFEPVVEYAYSVAGRDYTSRTLWREPSRCADRRAAEKEIRPYPSGTAVTVRYDRRDPSRSYVVSGDSTHPLVLNVFVILFFTLPWGVYPTLPFGPHPTHADVAWGMVAVVLLSNAFGLATLACLATGRPLFWSWE